MFEQAIRAAIREHPDLTAFGFGTYCGQDTFIRDQCQLFETETAFELAVDFIRSTGFKRHVDRHQDSYTLKHRCESWAGHAHWVPNGAFIAALHFWGADMRRDGPNAICNLRKVRPI